LDFRPTTACVLCICLGMSWLPNVCRGLRVHRAAVRGPVSETALFVRVGGCEGPASLLAAARPNRRAPPGNGCRPVRSLSESKSVSGAIPALNGTRPSCTAQSSLLGIFRTAIIRLRYPVSRVRIPPRVHSKTIPIPTPMPFFCICG